jgi:hypothetical protein
MNDGITSKARQRLNGYLRNAVISPATGLAAKDSLDAGRHGKTAKNKT